MWRKKRRAIEICRSSWTSWKKADRNCSKCLKIGKVLEKSVRKGYKLLENYKNGSQYLKIGKVLEKSVKKGYKLISNDKNYSKYLRIGKVLEKLS